MTKLAKTDDDSGLGAAATGPVFWIEKEKARLTLLDGRNEAVRPVVRSFQFWRQQSAGVPTAQSTRCSNLDVVVQRDSDRDIV